MNYSQIVEVAEYIGDNPDVADVAISGGDFAVTAHLYYKFCDEGAVRALHNGRSRSVGLEKMRRYKIIDAAALEAWTQSPEYKAMMASPDDDNFDDYEDDSL